MFSVQTPDGGLKRSLTSCRTVPRVPLATSARKQHPVRLERARRELLPRSMPCVVIAWLVAHWAEAAGVLELVPTPPRNMRSTSSVLVKFFAFRTVRSTSEPREANVSKSHPWL